MGSVSGSWTGITFITHSGILISAAANLRKTDVKFLIILKHKSVLNKACLSSKVDQVESMVTFEDIARTVN